MQITSKTEVMDEIIVIQNKIDGLGYNEDNDVLFDRLSSKKEKLCNKLKGLCDSKEYDRFVLSL